MTHTIDTIMALADAYAIPRSETAREALHAALVEALAKDVTETNFGNMQAAQPVRSLNEVERLDLIAQYFSDKPSQTKAMQLLTDFEQTTPLAQPVREPLTDNHIIDISHTTKAGKWSNIDFARAIERAHQIGGDV